MSIPKIIYGTAWKKDRTRDWVITAIEAGFRGIDTAGQPKHYHEPGVGEALSQLHQKGIRREDIFLQTKFTSLDGHDPLRIPYDPKAPLEQQVQQSFSSSLRNLGTHYVDSYVLHSPLSKWDQMMKVWQAMEKLHSQGGTRMLGISNCYDLQILQDLYAEARVKPAVIQNRFYADTDYDVKLREWCNEKSITYQSFWTLTANPHILGNSHVHQIAKAHELTETQVFLRFVTQLGIVPLTGTTSAVHMKEDLAIFDFEQSPAEVNIFHRCLEVAL